MAKRFRLNTLDQTKKDKLRENLYKFLPVNLHEAALDALEKTGSIPDEIYNQAIQTGVFAPNSLSGVKHEFAKIVGGLQSREVVYKGFADGIKDEANATDDELQDKIAALQGLGETGLPVDSAQVDREVKAMLDQYQVAGFRDELEKYLPQFILRNRRLPTPGEAYDDLKKSSYKHAEEVKNNAPFNNFLNNQQAKNYVAETLTGGQPNFGDDIRRIEDILGTRGIERRKEADVQRFLQTAPGELKAQRNLLYRQQQENAGKYLRTRLTPKIMEELNRRGLAENPGDVASLISREGTNLQSRIEDQIRSLEAEDNAFFADAAYRITQAKLEKNEDALRQQIAFEREQARSRQEASFRAKEQYLASEFEKRILTKDQERSVDTYKNELKVGSDAEKEVELANLATETGKAVGETAATAVATKTPQQIG